MPKKQFKIGRGLRRMRNFATVMLFILVLATAYFYWDTKLNIPVVEKTSMVEMERNNPSKNTYNIGANRLQKNDFGLWEMYLTGEAFEMGVANGKLTKELIKIQEDAFVEQINQLVPSAAWLKFLKYFIAWFNRDIDEYVLPEYQREIYGVSLSAADGYEYIGNNFERMLNYHAAHDIGHALKDLALVGCTSFASNLKHQDSSLIIGRNFDFYVNEDFAENKIVAFIDPEKGHKFMYITWASMIGVVSGMNDKGLTVTINAAKSDIPTAAATPISLLAREILQYAGNIEEAIAIAEERKTFVSESILIGSAADNDAVIIEKSPSKQGIFKSNIDQLVCSNHFQSETFANDKNNLEYIKESASLYRQERCEQLLTKFDTIDYLASAKILRDYNGLNDKDIGIGNEKTMAQMISHHSVIFLPATKEVWVSTSPYQLGKYLAYNLDSVFNNFAHSTKKSNWFDKSFTIEEDPFLYSESYTNFNQYKTARIKLKKCIEDESRLQQEGVFLTKFIELNPNYYEGYMLAGDYYLTFEEYQKAMDYYSTSLTKEFENLAVKNLVEEKLEEIKIKL